jgi:hypothetical protein
MLNLADLVSPEGEMGLRDHNPFLQRYKFFKIVNLNEDGQGPTIHLEFQL